MDPIEQFKTNQRATWAGFAALEHMTGAVAPTLVRFAGIAPGEAVLDVGSGTGVVALTAARLGARVTALDLTPELVAHARDNAALMQLEVAFHEGDVEAMPFPDGVFDVVVSQFGHMFAPRPDVAIGEMLRVLEPGGTIAFATWPPELFVGRIFALVGRHAPPPPPGVTPPGAWGDPATVRARLGDRVRDVTFSSATMEFPILSPQHYRAYAEEHLGPVQRVLATLDASDPPRAQAFRRELEELCAAYFHDNRVRQDYLLTRAVKA